MADPSLARARPWRGVNHHLIHGVVDGWTPTKLTHRIYVERASLRHYLEARAAKYSAWSSGEPPSELLTVDDSTRAGAEACLLARELGHEVLFFINPEPILDGQPYFFSYLDLVLDHRRVAAIGTGEQCVSLAEPEELRQFRKQVKRRLMRLPPALAFQEVHVLARELRASVPAFPPHLLPIELKDLVSLLEAGVRIGNHGWSHVDVASMPPAEIIDHVSTAREWIRAHLGVATDLYACPFGQADVSEVVQKASLGTLLLADGSKPCGPMGPCCWNRQDITRLLRGW